MPDSSTSSLTTGAACARIARARAAKCTAMSVCRWHAPNGSTVVSISVFELPPIESASSRVSLWLRYGMGVAAAAARPPAAAAVERLDSASSTSHSAVSDELIACASARTAPSAPESVRFSEPARSTRCSLPSRHTAASAERDSTCSVSTACERDECSFSRVAPVARAAAP